MLHVFRLLHYFFLASSLKINVDKTNMMRFGAQFLVTEEVAISIGYVPNKTPFNYLGLIVGGNMSHIAS